MTINCYYNHEQIVNQNKIQKNEKIRIFRGSFNGWGWIL